MPVYPAADELGDRFWSKIDRREPDECWPWTASLTASGYGQIRYGDGILYAHRLSYEATKGPIPDGHQVDHRCGNRACVNPDHLRPALQRDNVRAQTRLLRRNTSGVRGVSWSTKDRTYRVQVHVDSRPVYVGSSRDIKKAEIIAILGRARIHGLVGLSQNDFDRAAELGLDLNQAAAA